MFHPLDIDLKAQAQYDNLFREAEIYRQVKTLKGDQPGLSARLLADFGNFLIVTGQRLKGRKGSEMTVSVH